MQRLMEEHYDQQYLEGQYESLVQGSKLKLDFLTREIHAMTLYDPHVTLNVQVPHGIYLTLHQERPAGQARKGGQRHIHTEEFRDRTWHTSNLRWHV